MARMGPRHAQSNLYAEFEPPINWRGLTLRAIGVMRLRQIAELVGDYGCTSRRGCCSSKDVIEHNARAG